MDGQSRTHYLPRLNREFYQGDAVVHWTLTIFDRRTGWLNDSFHLKFRELLLHASVREGLFCPAYCLMPDHIHLLWLGLRPDSDQKNGMGFLRTYLSPLLAPHHFQPQAHDHVLREDERKRNAFAKICFYILANPIRAGLIKAPESWPFCGAIVPGYPDLDPRAEGFWAKVLETVSVRPRPRRRESKIAAAKVGADVRRLKSVSSFFNQTTNKTKAKLESRDLVSYK